MASPSLTARYFLHAQGRNTAHGQPPGPLPLLIPDTEPAPPWADTPTRLSGEAASQRRLPEAHAILPELP